MEMSYDAMGTKLSKKVSVGVTEQYTQHYLGGIEYNAVGATRKLEAIYFADGRVYNTNVTTASTTVALRYEYAIRDHLGNTRLMFADQGTTPDGMISSSEILQENHYYPFGMNMEGAWMNDAGSKDSKYLYNDKEFNDDFGFNWLDYGKRWYDPAIGRFPTVDPIIDQFPHLTPYNYASNDPILNIDLWGLQGINFNPVGYWIQQGNAMHSQARYAFDETMNSEPARRLQLFTNGLANTTFGLSGTAGAIGVEYSTCGLATLGAAAALTLSLGEMAVGASQMADALLGDANSESIIYQAQTLPGLMSEVAGSEYSGYVDALAGFAPGAVTGGNFKGGFQSFIELAKSIDGGDMKGITTNGIATMDSFLDITGVYTQGKRIKI